MNKIVRITFILVFLFGLLVPGGSIASPAAPQISVSPASAAPGTLVQINGVSFDPNGVPRVYWDTYDPQFPFLAQGQTNADGTLVINVAVPPDAASGAHTWLLVNQLRTGGTEEATAPFTVNKAAHSAVYIYNTEQATAEGFQAMLEARGMQITLMPLNSIDLSTSFSPYEMIIVGPDTGSSGAWGDLYQVLALLLSGKPVLGIGEGGYAFFGQMKSPIGYPNGIVFLRQTEVHALNPSDPLFNTPYKIPLSNGQMQVLIEPGNSRVIFLPQPDSRTYPFGEALGNPSYMSIIQNGRFLLWGFDSPAGGFTPDGIKLFTNTVYYLLEIMKKDTLILSNLSRMSAIGYPFADVTVLDNKITELVGLPASTTNMKAVWRDLASGGPATVTSAYGVWTNLSSVPLTNALVGAIDGFVEQLKRAAYPNLRNVILVGAHEVIPMKVRPADNYVENDWGIPAGYMYDLYHNGVNGSYLTDSVYGDLSYFDNGRGVDNELLPELAAGRLVETPLQIQALINTYIASSATMSRGNKVAIASDDYLDGAQAAANSMGATADTTLNVDGFASSLVPPKLNAKHGVVYIGGHGDFNWMTTQKWGQGFMAGATGSQGDTEELSDIPNAVIAAAGCHNGFNMTNRLYHDYSGSTTYGDFPERLANKKVGVYVGSTGYTWITLTGAGKNVADVGFSERLASSFIDHLLNDGMNTAGKAFMAAVSQYMAERPVISGADRRVIAITTLYGIPNYRWQYIFRPAAVKYGYSLKTINLVKPTGGAPQATSTNLQVTATINDWSLDNGVVQISGAAYYGDENYPVLPVISTSWVLPGILSDINISLDPQASTSITITNDVPTLTTGTTIDPNLGTIFTQPKTIDLTGLYPDPLAFSYTTSSPDGNDTVLAMSLVPVQYDPTKHETTIWTKLVFNVSYSVDDSAAAIDSDGDGLPDYWENGYGLDPNSETGDNGAGGDPDQDGLTNQDEFKLGTDPLNADTDHDGASDGFEISMHTDPLDPGSTVKQIFLPLILK